MAESVRAKSLLFAALMLSSLSPLAGRGLGRGAYFLGTRGWLAWQEDPSSWPSPHCVGRGDLEKASLVGRCGARGAREVSYQDSRPRGSKAEVVFPRFITPHPRPLSPNGARGEREDEEVGSSCDNRTGRGEKERMRRSVVAARTERGEGSKRGFLSGLQARRADIKTQT